MVRWGLSRMIWISFAVGAFIGATVGMMLMALAVASGQSSEVERLGESYRRGRTDGIRVAVTSREVDQHGSTVKH